MDRKGSRRAEARNVARELVEALESDATIDKCLMKAQRLARMLRDTDAQLWLDYETRGYPADFALSRLGTAKKYAWRWLPAQKILTASLPELEAKARAAEAVLNKIQATHITQTAANYLESRATTEVIGAVMKQIGAARDGYTAAVVQFSRMRSHLYRYAADTLVSLEFGDIAEDIFQAARNVADEFVRLFAPKAAEQLLAAEERMADGTSESLSASLTSCRRVLSTVADAVFPPKGEPYIDGSGKAHKVGEADYLNRLLAFLETRVASASTRSILDSQLSHLAARLDAVYAKACKGVHDDVAIDEARLVLVQTYLFLAEVARIAGDMTLTPSADAAEVEVAPDETASTALAQDSNKVDPRYHNHPPDVAPGERLPNQPMQSDDASRRR
jgi:hypothetical protein